VVALPLGRDQLDNAARVAHHGVGLRLKPDAKPEAIEKAVRRVLEEPSFSAAAERMAAAIAAETADDQAAVELEALASLDSSAANELRDSQSGREAVPR
jgi:UDP:flavonoid glycosyltransferase YjiC (YdhE family)